MEKLWKELAVSVTGQEENNVEDRQPEKWNAIQACQGMGLEQELKEI